ncbi:MAG: HAMP domain-containing protein [Bacteroidetes bacterium]|nr:HAMP domain-containing protein [Bacteroidota bacterium]
MSNFVFRPVLASLRAKVGVTYLVLVALTALIALFAAQRLVRLTRTVETVLRDDVGAVVALQNLVRELDRQDDALRTLAVADLRDPAADSSRAAFARAAGQFDAWLAEAEGRLVAEADLQALDTLAASYAYYQRAAAVVLRRAGLPGYSDDAPREAARRSAYVRAEAIRLLDRRARAVDDARRAAEADARRSATLVLAAAFGAFGVGLVLSYVFARSVVAPIEQLTRSVRQIGQGRMRQTVEIRTNDELAVLGREFNRMTERLDEYEAMNVQQLVAEKRTSEELVETMPSPLIVTDDDGRVVLLNDAALALTSRAEAWPMQSVEVVFPDETLRDALLPSLDRAPNALVEVGQGAEARVFRARHRRIEEAGLTVALLEDVTHFARLDRMKSDFLAAVSHELRTPLMSLGLATDLLLAGTPAPEQTDLLATIKDDHARLRRLVDGLIALARMDGAPQPTPHAPVDLASVVHDALTPLRLPFREKNVALDVRFALDLPVVSGDAEHLGWVVSNLAANALRHTSAGGSVVVSVHAKDARTLRLAVSDTGEGIPADQLDAVFGAFVQIKDRNTATPGSLGLGLALAKRIVDAHGGRIRAESTVGQGSTFVVELPAAAS